MIQNGRYYSVLRSIGSALHPGRSPDRRWVMVLDIRFYLDIAGGKPDSPVMTVAGYLARESEWTKFERVWGVILRDAGADEFHATDFYACQKKFKHIKRGGDRQAALEKRFVNAATKRTRFGFGLGFSVPTYHATMADCIAKARLPYRLPKGTGMDPRVYALSYALNRAAQRVLPRGTQTAVIFEHEQGIGAAIDYMNYLKFKRKEGWTGAYTTFTHATKAERPLQAADLLAYHACARIRDCIDKSDPPLRKPWDRMIARGNISLDISREEDFRTSSDAVLNFLREHPAYAVPNV